MPSPSYLPVYESVHKSLCLPMPMKSLVSYTQNHSLDRLRFVGGNIFHFEVTIQCILVCRFVKVRFAKFVWSKVPSAPAVHLVVTLIFFLKPFYPWFCWSGFVYCSWVLISLSNYNRRNHLAPFVFPFRFGEMDYHEFPL